MKPSTKLHHKVYGISQKLKPLSASAEALAFKNVFEKHGTTHRNNIVCLECNDVFKDAELFEKGFLKDTYTKCPSCSSKIKILQTSKDIRMVSYFTKIESNNGFQIVRLFVANKSMRKDREPIISSTEVIQHYIGLDGRITSMGIAVNGMARYYDSWRYDSDLTIMANDFHESNRGRLEGFYILPRASYLKEVIRNGFAKQYYDLSPQVLFSSLLKSTEAETLLKSNQIEMLKWFTNRESSVKKYWNSVKICIRNKYIIEEGSTWLDYMQLLEHFGKDLLSPKYVCPEDLDKAHNRLSEKKRRQIQAIKANKLFENIKQQEKKYSKDKKKFFGIEFSNGNITVKVLSSVRDIYEEGNKLKHCVYTNEYFDHKNALILSARIGDEPIETIEISLSKFKILQSRGIGNQVTPYNEEIKALVNENLYQIERIKNQKSA